MNGFLCINKTEGPTSRDVVNQVQRQIRPSKVGHAGTLDPLATGVLVVAVGRSTKLVRYVQRMQKRYRAAFELGKTSDTEDVTGNVTEREVVSRPILKEVESACKRFVGDIVQRPPAYSALRVNGKRAYELARKGESFELAERKIAIHRIEILAYSYPSLQLDVHCGSGTYIRSLGRDLGDALGCGAVMSALARTAIGPYELTISKPVSELADRDAIESHLQPPASGVGMLPKIGLTVAQIRAVSFGQKIAIDHSAEELAGLDMDGRLVAILTRSSPSLFRPSINFAAE